MGENVPNFERIMGKYGWRISVEKKSQWLKKYW